MSFGLVIAASAVEWRRRPVDLALSLERHARNVLRRPSGASRSPETTKCMKKTSAKPCRTAWGSRDSFDKNVVAAHAMRLSMLPTALGLVASSDYLSGR